MGGTRTARAAACNSIEDKCTTKESPILELPTLASRHDLSSFSSHLSLLGQHLFRNEFR